MNALHLRLDLDDREGALERLLGTLRRRGLGVLALSCGAPRDGLLAVTVRLDVGSHDPRRVEALLWRDLDLRAITDLSSQAHVVRRALLLRLAVPPHDREALRAVCTAFAARVLEITANEAVIEATGRPDHLAALRGALALWAALDEATAADLTLARPAPLARAS